jgi:hypothetical protein
MDNENHPKYLTKSAIFYKVCGGLFLFSILVPFLLRPLRKEYPGFLDILVGLPIFALFVLAPLGLFYSWKSYKRNEGLPKTRFKYLLGNLFFCILLILIIGIVVSDISKLFE